MLSAASDSVTRSPALSAASGPGSAHPERKHRCSTLAAPPVHANTAYGPRLLPDALTSCTGAASVTVERASDSGPGGEASMLSSTYAVKAATAATTTASCQRENRREVGRALMDAIGAYAS